MAGPSQEIKRNYALRDESHLFNETWFSLTRCTVIVIIISITVWAACTLLRKWVGMNLAFLFRPFDAAKQVSWVSVAILVGTLIVSGIVRGVMMQYTHWRRAEGNGTDRSIDYFHSSYDADSIKDAVKNRFKQPTFMGAVRRIIMTLLTVGMGGSGGLEGPVIPIGEALGAGWSRVFRVIYPDNLRAFQMAGIAAALTTLLNTPFAAAVFAAEIVFSDRIVYRTLLYSLIASVVCFMLNNRLIHFHGLEMLDYHPQIYTLKEYLGIMFVAIFCSAPAGLGVKFLFDFLHGHLNRFPPLWKATLGMLGTVLIALALWAWLGLHPEHILGPGESTINALINNSDPMLRIWWVLLVMGLAKALATGLTLMSGGSGGILFPAMYLGAVVGASVFYILLKLNIHGFGDSADIFIVAGIASALVAVVEVPLAAIIFVIEVFGANFGPPAIVAVVVCHKLVSRFRLYTRN